MTQPKYQEITNQLIAEITNGKFKKGQHFYSEAEICQNFGVSTTTAVKVLNLLQEKNYVIRFQGLGTFVAKEEHQQVVKLTDLNLNKHQPEDVRVLSVALKHDFQILKKLFLDPEEKYLEIVRLRLVGKKPVQYTTSFINRHYLQFQNDTPPKYYQSIYQRIMEKSQLDPYKLPFHQVTQAIEISDAKILQYFSSTSFKRFFISQIRTTYLPTTKLTGLEYTISYKDPHYWGIQVDAINNFNHR